MKIQFAKYQGTGNDFVMLDNRDRQYAGLHMTDIEHLCNRKFGIGADGLILLELKDGFDFHMKYYNSDGNESSMCGNGGRCITAFADRLHLINGETKFTAADGEHAAVIQSKDPMIVRLKMSDVHGYEEAGGDVFLNTGSPHYVKFIEDVMLADVVQEGRSIRYNDRFKEDGTNVNFVQSTPAGLSVRSYERGVEDETLSCGTGVTASVLAGVVRGIVNENRKVCEVKSMGGMLKVYFEKTERGFKNIWLEGEARYVFSGEIEI
jgi:diaminopimelate epimerase